VKKLMMGARPRPRLGPSIANWHRNKMPHLTLLFDSPEQEAAYRRWLADPASYDAFGGWFDQHNEE
jgi:hypothetical protein